jgi:hypothetical protein
MSKAIPSPDPTEKSTQALLLQQRNADLHKRFDELYKKKRIRHDDVLEMLSKEFYITPRTIRGILKEAPEVPAQPEPGEQTRLFS